MHPEASSPADARIPVDFEDAPLGYVRGPRGSRPGHWPCFSRISRHANLRAAHSLPRFSTSIAKCISSSSSPSNSSHSSTRLPSPSPRSHKRRGLSAPHTAAFLSSKQQEASLEPAASFGGPAGKPDPLGPGLALCRFHPRARHRGDRQRLRCRSARSRLRLPAPSLDLRTAARGPA